MGREIKFRVFNNEISRMTYGELEDYSWETVREMKSVIMQYTGLKDKNGKEIYEGDIVKSVNTNQIIFINGKYQMQNNSGWIGDINIDCEVIGNIYENPNLIV